MKRLSLLCLFAGLIVFNQSLIAASISIRGQSFEISGDFGSRRVLENGTSKCDFHRAIDLRGIEGTPFPLIENGIIKEIKYSTGGILIFTVVSSTNKTYRYLHMFPDSKGLPLNSGEFTLCKTNEHGLYAIIKWVQGQENKRAQYILCSRSDETVNIGNTRIRNADDTDDAYTDNEINIENHPYVGPIGTSGGYQAHMHIDMGWLVSEGRPYNKNPLYYITHNREEDFEIGLWDKNNIERKDGWIVRKDDANSYYLKITLTSVDTLNLDEVLIYIDSIDDNNLLWKFSYGGKPKEDGTENFPIHTDVEKGACSDGITDGVYSVDKDNNGESEVGYERFIFSKWEESLEVKENLRVSKLNSGKHELIIKARNVMGENKGEKRIKFNIVPSDYALYHSDTILPTPGPTGTPVAGTQYTNVVVKDLKQEPTEEPTEAAGTVTPAGSAVPSPTPEPEITEVPIKDYLKNVLYGLVGDANFSDGKYI